MLHDTLSQGLAGLILQLEAANAYLESGRAEKAHQIIQNTMERARTTLTDARRAIEDLREPSTPDCKDILQGGSKLPIRIRPIFNNGEMYGLFSLDILPYCNSL